MYKIKVGPDLYERQMVDQSALRAAYEKGARPSCMCTEGGVDLYISKINGTFYLKRMPSTGKLHATDCPAHELPEILSGLGDVLGHSIKEDGMSGESTLKLGFSLSTKGTGKAPEMSEGEPGSTVTADPDKLSMIGLLHYLWERAGLTKHKPGERRRKWESVRTELYHAASMMKTRKKEIVECLYLPEAFNKDVTTEQEARKFSRFNTKAGSKDLTIIISEMKSIEPARYGMKVTLKHLANWPIVMKEEMGRKIEKNLSAQLEFFSTNETSRLMAMCLVSVTENTALKLESLTLMNVTEDWIPVESPAENFIITLLTKKRRCFVKHLRYNMARSRPMAVATLTDTKEKHTAMYALPSEMGDQYRAELEEITKNEEVFHWSWSIDEAGEESFELPLAKSNLIEDKRKQA